MLSNQKNQCMQTFHIIKTSITEGNMKPKVVKMGGALVFTYPNDHEKAKDPHIWWIFFRGDLNHFIEACRGLDRRLADYIVNT